MGSSHSSSSSNENSSSSSSSLGSAADAGVSDSRGPQPACLGAQGSTIVDLHVGCHTFLGAAGDTLAGRLTDMGSSGAPLSNVCAFDDGAVDGAACDAFASDSCKQQAHTDSQHTNSASDSRKQRAHTGSQHQHLTLPPHPPPDQQQPLPPHQPRPLRETCTNSQHQQALPPHQPPNKQQPLPPLSAVTSGCDLLLSMARVGHHHPLLLTSLLHSLKHMHTLHAPTHSLHASLPAPNSQPPSHPSFPATLSLLPCLGAAPLAHTAAAFARLGAQGAHQVCLMTLQVLDLVPFTQYRGPVAPSKSDLSFAAVASLGSVCGSGDSTGSSSSSSGSSSNYDSVDSKHRESASTLSLFSAALDGSGSAPNRRPDSAASSSKHSGRLQSASLLESLLGVCVCMCVCACVIMQL